MNIMSSISHLDGRCVDLKLLEDGKGLLKQFTANGYVCNVWCVIVVHTVDVLHHAGAVCLDGCQDQQVLQVPEVIKANVEFQIRNKLTMSTIKLEWRAVFITLFQAITFSTHENLMSNNTGHCVMATITIVITGEFPLGPGCFNALTCGR